MSDKSKVKGKSRVSLTLGQLKSPSLDPSNPFVFPLTPREGRNANYNIKRDSNC